MKLQEVANKVWKLSTSMQRIVTEASSDMPYWAQEDLSIYTNKMQELASSLQTEANKTNAALAEVAKDVSKGRLDSLEALVKHSPEMTVSQFLELAKG